MSANPDKLKPLPEGQCTKCKAQAFQGHAHREAQMSNRSEVHRPCAYHTVASCQANVSLQSTSDMCARGKTGSALSRPIINGMSNRFHGRLFTHGSNGCYAVLVKQTNHAVCNLRQPHCVLLTKQSRGSCSLQAAAANGCLAAACCSGLHVSVASRCPPGGGLQLVMRAQRGHPQAARYARPTGRCGPAARAGCCPARRGSGPWPPRSRGGAEALPAAPPPERRRCRSPSRPVLACQHTQVSRTHGAWSGCDAAPVMGQPGSNAVTLLPSSTSAHHTLAERLRPCSSLLKHEDVSLAPAMHVAVRI